MKIKNGKIPKNIPIQYPDRESNAELSLRRTLLYPFNYQGNAGAKVRDFCQSAKILGNYLLFRGNFSDVYLYYRGTGLCCKDKHFIEHPLSFSGLPSVAIVEWRY